MRTVKVPRYVVHTDSDRKQADIAVGLDGSNASASRVLVTINFADPTLHAHSAVFFNRMLSALHEVDALEAAAREEEQLSGLEAAARTVVAIRESGYQGTPEEINAAFDGLREALRRLEPQEIAGTVEDQR